MAALTGGAAVLTLSDVSGVPLRAAVALPLVFVLPGYAIATAVFPDRALEFPERLVLGLGLSLAVVVLGGLVLNCTPWGLQATSWAVLLGGLTLVSAGVAFVRRRGAAPGIAEQARLGLLGRQWLLLGLAAMVIGGSIAVARIGAERQYPDAFAQLWILPAGGADGRTARLGLRSVASESVDYRVQVKVEGSVVREWPLIHVPPGGTWETTLALPDGPPGGESVETLLYRTDAPEVAYRRVVLELPS